MNRQEENTQNELFILRLNNELKRKKLTQSDLAYRAQIGQGTLSGYLNGKRSPGAAELCRICMALNVTMGWLWGMENAAELNQGEIHQENIKLKAKLDMAIGTLRGTLKSLITK